ncbi:dipeptide ABC transporter ATP-binding protein DppD [Acuticoccus sediminis]|uniref:Dipeptide ABC transporter ATP-binding protein DppD n=1 Tax=Acuticoccus sediminis TaxID=2184697 RepID=A0A8B2NVR5_9HYPH|nr:ABC transporter ATP-binding protein [Acuticoccus sediminis]RAI01853.1 dipeptide ABC transporter ATP-binding protein DppD [Acuticoccus sediminis]
MSEPLLSVENLTVHFGEGERTVRAVEDVSLTLRRGEVLAVVGESGSGKSVLSRSILRLVREPPGRTVGGRIVFEGRDVTAMSPAELRALRGDQISMIFQEPMASLNPVFTIGFQIAEALRFHRGLSRRAAKAAAIELLREVGMPDAERRFDAYPNQISGGMCQRAMIAQAIACRPKLLIADEPTTALDVTIQAQVLTLLRRLRDETGMAVILVTHNLGVVAEMADRVAVMYAGRIAEVADADTFFRRPLHPYSQGLMASVPRIAARADTLSAVPGSIPRGGAAVRGCTFAPRCAHAMPRCAETPPLMEAGGTRVACWLHADAPPAGGGPATSPLEATP